MFFQTDIVLYNEGIQAIVNVSMLPSLREMTIICQQN